MTGRILVENVPRKDGNHSVAQEINRPNPNHCGPATILKGRQTSRSPVEVVVDASHKQCSEPKRKQQPGVSLQLPIPS